MAHNKILNKNVKLSYLIPYALLATVLVTMLASAVGWQLHANYNQNIDTKVEARLSMSKK